MHPSICSPSSSLRPCSLHPSFATTITNNRPPHHKPQFRPSTSSSRRQNSFRAGKIKKFRHRRHVQRSPWHCAAATSSKSSARAVGPGARRVRAASRPRERVGTCLCVNTLIFILPEDANIGANNALALYVRNVASPKNAHTASASGLLSTPQHQKRWRPCHTSLNWTCYRDLAIMGFVRSADIRCEKLVAQQIHEMEVVRTKIFQIEQTHLEMKRK